MRIGSGCILAVMLSLGVSACTVTASAPRVVVQPGVEVVVARPPPPLRVEAVPPPPAGELYVWQPGHWRWEGSAYVWHGGHYERPPSATAFWVAPKWVNREGQWVFKPGHWAYR
jgi:hypothetical protein